MLFALPPSVRQWKRRHQGKIKTAYLLVLCAAFAAAYFLGPRFSRAQGNAADSAARTMTTQMTGQSAAGAAAPSEHAFQYFSFWTSNTFTTGERAALFVSLF